MRIKSFTAPTMQQAMNAVREALGDDAIIVSTMKHRRGGVEITAALDDALPMPAAQPLADDAADISAHLRHHRLPETLIDRLGAVPVNGHGPAAALAAAIDRTLAFAPVNLRAGQPIMLVGPPGVGKTVTVAKLAARAVLQGVTVTAISCDTTRAGGLDQLAAYVRLMRQTLIAVENAEQLDRALAAGGPMLIDTPGVNPFSAADMATLLPFLQRPGVEPVLVLPAGYDPEEAADIALAFAELGVRRLIATRLDAARRYGAPIAAAQAGRLALAEAGVSPYVADGLQSLSADALARLLLLPPGATDPISAFNGTPS